MYSWFYGITLKFKKSIFAQPILKTFTFYYFYGWCQICMYYDYAKRLSRTTQTVYTNLRKFASSVSSQMRGEREEIRGRSLEEMCITPTGNRAAFQRRLEQTPVRWSRGSWAESRAMPATSTSTTGLTLALTSRALQATPVSRSSSRDRCTLARTAPTTEGGHRRGSCRNGVRRAGISRSFDGATGCAPPDAARRARVRGREREREAHLGKSGPRAGRGGFCRNQDRSCARTNHRYSNRKDTSWKKPRKECGGNRKKLNAPVSYRLRNRSCCCACSSCAAKICFKRRIDNPSLKSSRE